MKPTKKLRTIMKDFVPTYTRFTARFLPARSLRAASLLSILIVVAVTAILTIGTPRAALALNEISVNGELTVKLKPENQEIIVDGGSGWKHARLLRQHGTITFTNGNGDEIASASKSEDGNLMLRDKKGSPRFVLVADEEGYRIFNMEKVLQNRVKIKPEKFNLYDGEGKRIAHGKAKPDGWGVKNENGEQTLKIKGPASLKEASYFALPIDAELRLVAWAGENL